jgi:hypothetical protein
MRDAPRMHGECKGWAFWEDGKTRSKISGQRIFSHDIVLLAKNIPWNFCSILLLFS